MKRAWKYLFPVALTICILAAGVLVPLAFIRVRRNSYILKNGVVAAADVEVYSEEYETNRSCLLRAIRQLEHINEETEIIPEYENLVIYDSSNAMSVSGSYGSIDYNADYQFLPDLWTEQQRELYNVGYGLLETFLYSWDSEVADTLLNASDSTCLLQDSDTSEGILLGAIWVEDNLLIFDLETGVPLCINLFLEDVKIADKEEFCENLLSVYSQFVGISFSDTESELKNIDKSFYYYVQSESADGTFQLSGDMYFEQETDTLQLCLFLLET